MDNLFTSLNFTENGKLLDASHLFENIDLNVDVAAILAILSIHLSMYVLIVFLCWTYSLDYRIT